MLRAVSLCAIYRSPIRGSDAIFHGCEQSLQRVANDSNEALWKRLHGTTELHLEPLHGYRLKRRILAVLGGGEPLPSPPEILPRVTSLRPPHQAPPSRSLWS